MAPGPFRLQGISDSFQSKVDSVFGGLRDLEKQHGDQARSDAKEEEEPDTLQDSQFSIPRSWTQLDRRGQRLQTIKKLSNQQDCSRDGQFRRPQGIPPPRRRPKVADHRLHPERWMKYSLQSVSDNDLSEEATTAAAMSFLMEQSAKRHTDDQALTPQVSHSFKALNSRDLSGERAPASISFAKRFRRMETDQASDDVQQSKPPPKVHARTPGGTSASGALRHVLPEYVVGSSGSLSPITKKHTILGPRTGVGDRVNLSYLARNEDDSDRQPDDNMDSATTSSSCDSTNRDSVGESMTTSDSLSESKGTRMGIDDLEDTTITSPPTSLKRRKFRGNMRTRNLEDVDD